MCKKLLTSSGNCENLKRVHFNLCSVDCIFLSFWHVIEWAELGRHNVCHERFETPFAGRQLRGPRMTKEKEEPQLSYGQCLMGLFCRDCFGVRFFARLFLLRVVTHGAPMRRPRCLILLQI